MKFEWDPNKALKNLKKHGVSFNEAASVFGDQLSVTFTDPDHSNEENRYITVGVSHTGKVLIVAHVDRNDCVRIISVRKTTRYERRFYEEGK